MDNANYSKCNVYALYSSEDGVIRYIGQTTGNINRRLKDHLSASKYTDRKVSRWISSVAEKGFSICVFLLKEKAIWNFDEIFYIDKYCEFGFDLVNSTSGGGGILKPCEETRNKISNGNKGKIISEECKKLISDSMKKVHLSKLHKKKMISGMKKAYSERGDEIRKKISDGLKGRVLSDETKRKMSDSKKGAKPWLQKNTDEEVYFARELFLMGVKQYILAKLFNSNSSRMSYMIRGISYKHVPMPIGAYRIIDYKYEELENIVAAFKKQVYNREK